MNYKYNQKLPKKVEKELDAYIERIKAIKWFKPSADLKKEDAEKQIDIALEAFGVKASFEWRSLKTEKDWDAAWDAAWGANEVLVKDIKEYKGKFAFLSLIPLWEMGLYPIGVINGKFVIYLPE